MTLDQADRVGFQPRPKTDVGCDPRREFTAVLPAAPRIRPHCCRNSVTITGEGWDLDLLPPLAEPGFQSFQAGSASTVTVRVQVFTAIGMRHHFPSRPRMSGHTADGLFSLAAGLGRSFLQPSEDGAGWSSGWFSRLVLDFLQPFLMPLQNVKQPQKEPLFSVRYRPSRPAANSTLARKPPVRRFSNRTSAPCRSAMALTMARPKPVPGS